MSNMHCVTVALLRALLDELRDTDVLIPNQVANLKIIRDGWYIGFVDLLDPYQAVELFEEGDLTTALVVP